MKWWACAWLASIACFNGGGGGGGSGGSGVPGNTRLPDLTVMQQNNVCEYLAQAFPRRTVTCGENTDTVGISVSECLSELFPSPESCTATVDQTEACFEALGDLSDEELCDLQSIPASCAPLLSEACLG